MHGAYCTDIRHHHRGGMLNKTPPPTELQIPATVTTLAGTVSKPCKTCAICPEEVLHQNQQRNKTAGNQQTQVHLKNANREVQCADNVHLHSFIAAHPNVFEVHCL